MFWKVCKVQFYTAGNSRAMIFPPRRPSFRNSPAGLSALMQDGLRWYHARASSCVFVLRGGRTKRALFSSVLTGFQYLLASLFLPLEHGPPCFWGVEDRGRLFKRQWLINCIHSPKSCMQMSLTRGFWRSAQWRCVRATWNWTSTFLVCS